MPTPTKRSYAMSTLSDDSENVDPVQSLSTSKKNKIELFSTPVKSLSSLSPSKQDLPTFAEPRQLGGRFELSPSKTPLSAPAGRSPKRRTIGLAKSRRSFMPYTRVDPPFASRSASSLPFSLDAALNSTLGATPMPSKAVPSKWKFEIYEDTSEEEAATLMEHSTLTLDLSSDDEGTKEKRMDRGKENTPPEGYDAPTAASANAAPSTSQITAPARVNKLDIVRRKMDTDQMDDGQRTPLSDVSVDVLSQDVTDTGQLDIEPFSTIEAGEDSFVVVEAETQSEVQQSTSAVGTAVKTSVPTATPSEDLVSSPATATTTTAEDKAAAVEAISKVDIVIFEDEPVVEFTVSAEARQC